MPAMVLMAALAAAPALPPGADAFIRHELGFARYHAAAADLNGDGRPELLVHAEDDGWCGSGGCTLAVLAPHGRGYRVVTRITVARRPVRVLATATLGWRDLGVRVAGGGLPRAHEARLRFDGRSYPRNPTVVPETRAGAAGRVVLD